MELEALNNLPRSDLSCPGLVMLALYGNEFGAVV